MFQRVSKNSKSGETSDNALDHIYIEAALRFYVIHTILTKV